MGFDFLQKAVHADKVVSGVHQKKRIIVCCDGQFSTRDIRKTQLIEFVLSILRDSSIILTNFYRNLAEL
jgi:hypothetical protein